IGYVAAAARAQHRAHPVDPFVERSVRELVDRRPVLPERAVGPHRVPAPAGDRGQPSRTIELRMAHPRKLVRALACLVDPSETECGHNEICPLDGIRIEGAVLAETELEQ